MAFYLDAGPLSLVYFGLMNADDPEMRDTLAWFRAGPQKKVFRSESSCWQIPMLVHEISSCEPVYSWNIEHSRRLGDRERYLEGLYSLFAGGMSRQTFISCETRGGITGNIFSHLTAIHYLRMAIVEEQPLSNELHLCRLAPSEWFKDGGIVLKYLQTEFGTIDFRAAVSADGKRMEMDFEAVWRYRPAKVVCHIPPLAVGAKIRINGKAVGNRGKCVILPD